MATPTPEDQVDAFALSRAALVAQAVESADGLVRDFRDWYETEAITALAASIVARVEAAQRGVASVTDAYLARVASTATGRRVRPVGGVPDMSTLREGVTHAGAYGRVADHYRWRRSEGDEPEVAQAAAVQRARVIAETDTDLAFREAAHRFVVERDADGYRRVIRPERSLHGSCGLCVVAADRVYSTDELLPLHNGCKCTVLPIYGEHDPGRQLNRDDLRAIYKAAGGTARANLQATRVTVNQHGELGPVLSRADYSFRDPAQVAKDTRDP